MFGKLFHIDVTVNQIHARVNQHFVKQRMFWLLSLSGVSGKIQDLSLRVSDLS